MRNPILASVILLAACSQASDDEGSGIETDVTLSLGDGESAVPEKLYIQCKYPTTGFGGTEMTATVDYITVDGDIYNYDSSSNETTYECSPPREGCRDRIEDGMIISQREPLLTNYSSIIRVNIDTLEATRVELIDGKEVPAKGEITCEKPEYPEGVTKGFGM